MEKELSLESGEGGVVHTYIHTYQDCYGCREKSQQKGHRVWACACAWEQGNNSPHINEQASQAIRKSSNASRALAEFFVFVFVFYASISSGDFVLFVYLFGNCGMGKWAWVNEYGCICLA